MTAMFLFAAVASSAFGAASLQINGASPGKLAPGATSGSGQFNLSFTNIGDAALPGGSATVSIELPAEMTAEAVVPDGTSWSCTTSPDKRLIECTGPSAPLPVGKSVCELNIGFVIPVPCSISLTVKANPNAPVGPVTTEIEACVTGAPPCTIKQAVTAIQHFGHDFGIASINDGAGPGPEVPAIPGTKAFWAGACDRGVATSFGTPIPAPGVGSRPASIPAPIGGSNPLANMIAAPSSPAHCIDIGAPGQVGGLAGLGIWSQPPAWRLPPSAQAGSHPDGSMTLAMKRAPNGFVDGNVDNIVVELPEGFVGNPNATTKCPAKNFALRPPLCPPSSQVGVLDLYIITPGVGGDTNWANAWYTASPVWNLEPRDGRAAEFGFAYASGEKATTVRIGAKARTNGNSGVTAFVGQIPAALPPIYQTITLWGVPWAAENDLWRAPVDLLPSNTGCSTYPGNPANTANYIPIPGLTPECQVPYDSSWGPIKPFISQETDCNPAPAVTGRVDQFLEPGDFVSDGTPVGDKLGILNGDPDPSDPDWKSANSAQAAVTGCERLRFDPSITLDPTSQSGAAVSSADSPTGLDVELEVPQNNDAPVEPPPPGSPQVEIDQYVDDASAYFRSDAGLATAHLKDTTVTLPDGMTLNPSAASGQGACTTEQIGLTTANSSEPPRIRFDNGAVECPESSKIGEVMVETPLLEAADWPTGNVYLAKQGANPFNSDFAIYIAVASPARGVIVKLAGKVTPDPATGRLTTTVVENPELPFERFSLKFKRGPSAPLATPTTCGTHTSVSSFSSHARPNSPVTVNDPFAISTSPAGGCATSLNARPFDIELDAGSEAAQARQFSAFHARFERGDGEQELDRIEVTTPEGFSGKLAGIPYCSEAAIQRAIDRTATGDGALELNDPSCPAASKVGTTTIGAGAGSSPYYVTGNVYLAGRYKRAPLSMVFIVPAVAGPFDLGVQVVRAQIQVNERTAQITTVSDAIPKILRGVPLRLRDIRVDIDRPQFTLNPSDCSPEQIKATILSAQRTRSDAADPFQASGCAALRFKPRLALRLTGRKQVRTGKHPGIRATVHQKGVAEAGIEKAEVRLPKSLALDPNNAQALCEFEAGTRPDLENHCPKGSIVGRARAVSPLLNDPLVGNVYFVKNVRIDKKTGNQIRTLPMIIVALRGEIAINLVGKSDTTKSGKLVNTFDQVPDAPITSFNLNIKGGSKGILAVTRTRRARINLCAKPRSHVAEADMDGHNGRHYDRDIRMRTPCSRRQVRAAKGKGKRAASRRPPARPGSS